jgi:hypothetical protein
MITRFGILVLAVFAAMSACQCGTEPPADEPPGCVLDADCPADNICRVGVCAPRLVQSGEGEGEGAEGEGEGEGEGPVLIGELTALPTGEVEFGAVRLGSAVERVITLRNVGTAPLTITTIVIDDNDEGTFAVEPVGNVAIELAPSEEVGLVLTHTPDDGLPNRSELKVLHSGASSLLSVPLFAEFKGVSTLSVTSLPAELTPDVTTIDFGVRPLGMSTSTTLWVRNDGAADSVLGIAAALVTPGNAGFAVVADLEQPRYLSAYEGDCVAVASECPAGAGAVACEQGACRDQAGQLLDAVPLTVLYAPTTAAIHTATLTIRSDVGGVADSATEIELTGVGAAGVLQVDPPMITFERVYVGSSGRATLTARNAGGAALTLNNASLRFANATFAMEPPAGFPGFPYALAPGEQLPMTVVFTPTFAGQFNNEIVWDLGDAGAMDASTPVVGNALLAPGVVVQTAAQVAINLDTGVIDFGDVPTGLQSPLQLRVINGGVAGSVLHVTRMTIDGPQAGRFAMTPTSIASPLSSAINNEPHAGITLTYLPSVVTTVADQATLIMETDDPLRPSVSLPLRGRATNPDIVVSTTSIDFGPVLVGTLPSPTRTVTLRNEGFGNLAIADIAAPSQPSFTLSSSVPLPAVLPSLGQLVVTVTFAPTTTAVVSANIIIASNDPDRPEVSVSLVGSGGACPPRANASVTVVGGACVYGCNAGFHGCGDACLSNTSPDSCGTSCSPCDLRTGTERGCTAATSTCTYTCSGGRADLDGDRGVAQSVSSTGCEYACPVVPPTAESCDLRDDNCNGQADEGLAPDAFEGTFNTNDSCPVADAIPVVPENGSNTINATIYPMPSIGGTDEDWYIVEVDENDAVCFPFSTERYRAVFNLTGIPPGSDYDLHIVDPDNCGSIFGVSAAGGNANEQVSLDFDGTCGLDDNRLFRVRVFRFGNTGGSCDDYQLSVAFQNR